MDRINIHCAQWVVPVTSPLIRTGAVVIKSGRIMDFGPRESMLTTYDGEVFEHGQAAILPALANTHTHLELSLLKDKLKAKSNFVEWVSDVVQLRSTLNQDEISESIDHSVKELINCGTLLVGEVTNTGLTASILGKSFLTGTIFFELLGFSRERAFKVFHEGVFFVNSVAPPPGFSVTLSPHAVYSVHESLFQSIKEHNKTHKLLSTVHLAESREESAFLHEEESVFRRFLLQRGVWENNWVPPHKTPVAYLDELGFLDESTICVHLAQATDDDIKLLSARKAKISICIRSNLHTGVGLPPLDKFLQAGLVISLGTDSLASNEDLNIFGEMLAIRRYFPEIKGERILQMATINGAKALNLDKNFGSIEQGKKVPLVMVKLEDCSEESVVDAILHGGYEEQVAWLFD